MIADTIEKISSVIRHQRFLRKADWLWNALRPAYDAALRRILPKGLSRNFNGSDRLQISVELRAVTDIYEPEVWHRILGEVRPGDVFVDVGAHVGLYALAAGKRVGPIGQVIAFEPEPANHRLLCENIALNGLGGIVLPERKAVGASVQTVSFLSGRGSESRLSDGSSAGITVDVVMLDSYQGTSKIDLLKIDVEGFEQAVLEGANKLLGDLAKRPRNIFIEVHPYAWDSSGSSSEVMLSILRNHGYRITFADGSTVEEIRDYGEIFAQSGSH